MGNGISHHQWWYLGPTCSNITLVIAQRLQNLGDNCVTEYNNFHAFGHPFDREKDKVKIGKIVCVLERIKSNVRFLHV
jgi:hypothetical protein